MVDLPDEKVMCHHTGFQQNCRELVCSGKCNRWIQIQGYDANTGVQFNESNCIDNWTPRLLVEHSRQTRSTAAAVGDIDTAIVGVGVVVVAVGAVRACATRKVDVWQVGLRNRRTTCYGVAEHR